MHTHHPIQFPLFIEQFSSAQILLTRSFKPWPTTCYLARIFKLIDINSELIQSGNPVTLAIAKLQAIKYSFSRK